MAAPEVPSSHKYLLDAPTLTLATIDPHGRPQLSQIWFLAEDGNELVGVCLTWKEGWIKDLAVAPGARGRGLGESLVRHALARLYTRGLRRVGLKVDARNPTGALRLYERVGMSVVKRYRFYVKKL